MSRRTTGLLRAGLAALYHSGGHRLLAPLTQGVGAILMLHRVVPDRPEAFQPNRILQITPRFLEQAIVAVRDQGYDIVSLDEVHQRLSEGAFDRPFVAFSFDDGYVDNYDLAYPIFTKHRAPFAIYVPSEFPDGNGELWWLTLETIIASVDRLVLKMDGRQREFRSATTSEKNRAFHTIYWWLRGIDEREARRVVRDLCRGIGFDPGEHGRTQMMNWRQLQEISRDSLVTIGAHTRHHFSLAKLGEAEARAEIEEGRRRLERELRLPCRHLSFPYGGPDAAGAREFRLARELGFKTAVTTRKGVLHAAEVAHLTALPRVSLNGDYQDERFLQVLLSGAPFALLNGLRRFEATGA